MAIKRDVLLRSLMKGKNHRVADKLGVSYSTVCSVNRGDRVNIEVLGALREEESLIMLEADQIIAEEEARQREYKEKTKASM